MNVLNWYNILTDTERIDIRSKILSMNVIPQKIGTLWVCFYVIYSILLLGYQVIHVEQILLL